MIPRRTLRRTFSMQRKPLFIQRRILRLRRRVLKRAWHPEWRGVFEKYSRVWVKDNYFRVKHTIDSREDALQECGVVFAKCCNAYPHISNGAWFMGVYKRALFNRWATLSNKDTTARSAMEEYVDFTKTENAARGVTHIPWLLPLSEISQEAASVLTAIIEAPEHVLRLIFRGAPQKPAVYNHRMSSALGIKITRPDVYAEICYAIGKKPF